MEPPRQDVNQPSSWRVRRGQDEELMAEREHIRAHLPAATEDELRADISYLLDWTDRLAMQLRSSREAAQRRLRVAHHLRSQKALIEQQGQRIEQLKGILEAAGIEVPPFEPAGEPAG